MLVLWKITVQNVECTYCCSLVETYQPHPCLAGASRACAISTFCNARRVQFSSRRLRCSLCLRARSSHTSNSAPGLPLGGAMNGSLHILLRSPWEQHQYNYLRWYWKRAQYCRTLKVSQPEVRRPHKSVDRSMNMQMVGGPIEITKAFLVKLQKHRRAGSYFFLHRSSWKS